MMSRAFLAMCMAWVLCGAKRTNQKVLDELETDKERPFGGGFGDVFGGGDGFGGGHGGMGGFPGGFSDPFQQPQQPQQQQQAPAPETGGHFGGFGGFDDVFGGGGPNKPQPEQTGGGGGMFPGFDMNGMMDMMGGIMGDAMNCMQKEHEICCSQGTDGVSFRTTVCLPLWYCLIAVGERDFGPVPPCNAPIQFGDASKCKKNPEEIRSEMGMAKSMCFGKIQELYVLQGKLGQCMADVGTEQKKVEDERQGLVDLQNQAEECERQKAEAKAQQSLGTQSGDVSGQFCPAESAALTAAMASYVKAVGQCISVQISASVQIPEINIELPEIKVGVVSQGSFDLQMPDFSAPDFTGDIVVPGGGGKLNVAVGAQGQHGQQGQQGQQGQGAKLTFEQRMANIKADIKECEDAKPALENKQKEIAGAKDNVLKQKEKACLPESLLELRKASPEAETAIQVFQMMKMVWTCQPVGVAIDELIAVLHRC